MWPFNCKECPGYQKKLTDSFKREDIWKERYEKETRRSAMFHRTSKYKWRPLSDLLPINTNLLVANKDFSYFGFLFMDDGWDNSRKINMYNKGTIWATYTNPESISWWLNLDEIKK